jgi:hypothetical protein
MKTSILVLLAILPSLAFANPTAGQPDPTAELAAMTQKLNLSSDQQSQIRPILVAEFDKRTSIQSDTTLTAQQKHDQIGVVHRAAFKQIRAIFTPEQMALIEQGQNHPLPSPTHPSTSTSAPTTQN